MFKTTTFLLCFIFVFQAACASAGSTPTTEVATVYRTRVFTNESCLYNTSKTPDVRAAFLGALAAAVLPALIEKSLDRFATALRRAGEKSTVSLSGSTNVEIATKSLPACIQIVHGKFYLKEDDFKKGDFTGKKFLTSIPNEGTAYDTLKSMGAYIADRPILFFEAYITKSTDGTAIALGPTALIYNGLLESPEGNPKTGTRDLVFSFAIGAAGPAGGQDKGTIGQIEFLKLPANTALIYKGKVPETPWIPIQLTDNKAPRNVTLTVSETKDANQFLLFLADVLDGSKEEVETVLKQTLIESERLKVKQLELTAEKEKQTAETKALSDAIDAQSQAKIAFLAYKAAKTAAKPKEELIQKAADAFKKMLDANLKAKHAGLDQPFADDDLGTVQSEIIG